MAEIATPNHLQPRWNEDERLDALRSYEILDTDPESAFDDIAELAAHICEAPIAVVNFVHDKRQWFKAVIGLSVRETPLDISICAHAILQDDLFIVPDTTIDPRFAGNPLVTGQPHLRFYAGALLKTPSGLPIGTVCVLGFQARPRGLARDQASALQALARAVMRELDLRLANKSLQQAEERLRLALQAGRMFAWERDLQSGVVIRSEQAKEIVGLETGPASDFADRLHPEDRHRAASWGFTSDQKEIRYIHPDGRLMWLSSRGAATQTVGGRHRQFGVTFDVTDRKLAEQELWRVANHDALTGLANRSLFHARLAAALEAAEASRHHLSLLLLDLDDFKSVNDTLGHDAGDALLIECARRLTGAVRTGDTVARLGGDEFAIILVQTDLDQAARAAASIAETMARTYRFEGRALSTRTSIGIAGFPDHHSTAGDLLKDADIALYRAKAERRGRAVVYTEAARSRIEQRVRVLDEIRDGLHENQFVPFYQPKISLATGQIVGFEALARWQHPEKGLLTPGSFSPAFHDPERAVAIGASMMRLVTRDLKAWLEQGWDCGRIAINLAAAEFADADLAKKLLAQLAAAGIPPNCFEVEVTETVFLERQSQFAMSILRELSHAGVSIALDDFGTGFASLTHLKRYPVHHLKIDQSFIRDLETDREDAAIVSAVINLGQSMGMEVTAEGVETAGQAARLRAMGCDQAQGYFYAKPMAATRVPWLLSNWAQPDPGGDARGFGKHLDPPHMKAS